MFFQPSLGAILFPWTINQPEQSGHLPLFWLSTVMPRRRLTRRRRPKRRRKLKRKHSVRAELQIMELSKSGTSIKLEIYTEENQKEKLGTLIIGRGSMTWY